MVVLILAYCWICMGWINKALYTLTLPRLTSIIALQSSWGMIPKMPFIKTTDPFYSYLSAILWFRRSDVTPTVSKHKFSCHVDFHWHLIKETHLRWWAYAYFVNIIMSIILSIIIVNLYTCIRIRTFFISHKLEFNKPLLILSFQSSDTIFVFYYFSNEFSIRNIILYSQFEVNLFNIRILSDAHLFRFGACFLLQDIILLRYTWQARFPLLFCVLFLNRHKVIGL